MTAHLYIKVDVSKEHIRNNQSGELGGLYIFQLAKRYVNLNIRNCTLYILIKNGAIRKYGIFSSPKCRKWTLEKYIKKEQNWSFP